MPSIGATHDHEDTDGVFINVLLYKFGVESVLALLADIQNSSFNLKVASELLQSFKEFRVSNSLQKRYLSPATCLGSGLLPKNVLWTES